MAIADVVTMGFGSFSSVNKLPTLGYSIGLETVTFPGATIASRVGVGSTVSSRIGVGGMTVSRKGPGATTGSRKTT